MVFPALAVSVIVLGGTPVPVQAFLSIPTIAKDIASNQPPQKIMADLVPVIEAMSDVLVPGMGLAEQIVFALLGPSHPMTHEEEMQWMERYGIGTQQ